MALVAAFCLVVMYLATETQADCRYTVIAQKGLRVNTPEDIYVNFHECEDMVTVVAILTSLPRNDHEHARVTVANKLHLDEPVKMTLQAKSGFIEQNDRGNPVHKAVLEINYCFGLNCGAPWQAIPTSTILLNTTRGYIFMTTDRPAYRPGEKVRIALALTNQHLKPEPEAEPRPIRIVIKTPEESGKDQGRIVVHDSENKFIQAPATFLDYDYEIPSDPLRGIWWAEAHVDGIKMAEKSFIIDTYELPTFQVKIIPKYHFMLETLSHIEGEVTAEYSYGEKVDGSYYMSFRLVRSDGTETEFHKIPQSFGRSALITRGSIAYEVPKSDLENVLREDETISDLVENNAKLVIMASVTGKTEGVFESDVVDNIIFTRSPFIIDHSQSAKFYIQGTVYALKVMIKDVQSGLPLPDIPVTIEWGGRPSKVKKSDKYGEIYDEIDNFSENAETVVITTGSEHFQDSDQSRVRFQVRKYLLERKLGMRLNKQIAEVGNDQHITFVLDPDDQPDDIRFFVIARGNFVHAATKVIEDGQSNEVSASFTVTASMVPNARVVAYYILGGEMTSNSAWFDITNKCETELVITPEQDTVEPGGNVIINIKGAPNAKVYVSATDRAAYFVHNGTRLNRAKLWSKMEQYDTACSRKGGLDATNVFEEAGLTIRSPITPYREYRKMYCESSRKKRSPTEPRSEQQVLDSELKRCQIDGKRKNVFGLTCDQRVALITENLGDQQKSETFISKCISEFLPACISAVRSPTLGRAAAAGDKANDVRNRVRENFDENWIFQERRLKANGKDKIVKNALDSITYFDIDAFGLAPDSPMCVAETKSVKVFTNVFIQLYLPYSVRVHEKAAIRFSVFNYGARDEELDIHIRHSKELCSKFLSDEFQFLITLFVAGHSAETSSFTILPLKGDKSATIEIKAVDRFGDRDSIIRNLLIEEQGQHNESSQTIVLKPGENGEQTTKTITFDIPERSVMPKTKKCFVYAYAHPMGPSIEIDPLNDRLKNMDGYIHQPAGCGEQNMIRIGPIVYIHKYRVTVNEAGATVEQHRQVVAFIQQAYTIELKWRSTQVGRRAFAVWHYAPPSTWLNAFVTKVFAAAREFWPTMPTEPICSALDWLLEKQNNEQGDFIEDYKVHHQDMRGLVEDKISLTAYVSVSLVESASTCPDLSGRLQAAANMANTYLKNNVEAATGKPYTLAMGAYALAMSEGKTADARRWNQLLRDTKANDGEYIFWQGTRGRAANIETTAYALLAELQLNGINEENDELTRNIAHWLISQRNAAGGFVSTQDTVVALQALSTYMSILETSETQGPPPTNLAVEIASSDEDIKLSGAVVNLTPENAMRRMEIFTGNSSLLARAGGITVKVAGVGTGSLAYRCVWRQYADDGECQFDVGVEVEDDTSGDPKIKILKVDVRKPEGPPAQISIIDVGILSGFKPDENSIKQLCVEKAVDASADRYEITDNTVKFYLRNISSVGVKLGFIIREESEVFNRQPSYVSAYDYYEPDIRCTKFYTETGDYQVRTSNCDRNNPEDERFCKCAEGDCPKCRTRVQQLRETICSNHARTEHDQRCDLCHEQPCYNLHRETCNSDYLYVVNVTTEVNDDQTPYFKYFLAEVNEVIRATAHHLQAKGSTIKFLIRQDCYDACKDDAHLSGIATARNRPVKHYITPGRLLLVYGSHPTTDNSEDIQRYVYDLAEGGMEMIISAKKCLKMLEKMGKLERKVTKCNAIFDRKCNEARGKLQSNKEKLKICIMRSILRRAHTTGCD